MIDREARHIRIAAMLAEERGDGYALAFKAAVAAVCRFATERAGIRGLTKSDEQTLKNCIADLIGKARHAGREGVIPWALAEELRGHAVAEMEETVARLGLRGGK
jgi:hypothetical protein